MVAGMQVLGAIAIGYIISRWGLEEPSKPENTRPDVDQGVYGGYTLIKVTHMKTNPDTGSTYGCGQFERRLSDGSLDEVNGRVFVVMGRNGSKWEPLGGAGSTEWFGAYLFQTKAECYAEVDRLASPSDLGDPEVQPDPEPEETPDPEPPVSPPIFPGGGGMSSGQDLGGYIETDYSGGRRGGMFGY